MDGAWGGSYQSCRTAMGDMDMRSLMIVTALLAVSACNRGGTANNSGTTANTTNSAAAAPTRADNAVNNAAGNAAVANPADAELAAITKSNAEDATAQAVALPKEKDPDARAATCIVFLGISREQKSRAVGHDDAAMRQAQDQWKSELRQRYSQTEMDQLTGSSVNMLMPAAAAQRDAASRWCVQNAPEVDPEG
jgi:CCR4-NOT transcriptional regulation complex NOT5 subunit